MSIAVIGTGYVGLVSGTCFAEMGFDVTCIDKDQTKISRLKKAQIPIYEPGLKELVKKNIAADRLSFTDNLKTGVKGAKTIFIAVGTPTNEIDGSADLSYVFAAAREIAEHIENDSVVVIKSTVPLGTGRKMKEIIAKANPRLKFHTVSNPEFLREGRAVKDFLQPDRVIIGVDSEKSRAAMQRLYQSMINENIPVIFTDIETAELTKYAANAFLATKIAFINEMADLCDKSGANIDDVSLGLGLDPRIGKDYLKTGPGFGGSCFPKDTLALRKIAFDLGAQSEIVESVIAANDKRKLAMAEKIIKANSDSGGGGVKGKTIAALGLTFKADTDDIRASAALTIIPELVKNGAKVKAYDPQGMNNARKVLSGDIEWCDDVYQALEEADSAVIITEWQEFAEMDLAKVKSLLKKPLLVDLRNMFYPEDVKKAGLNYISLGREAVYSDARYQMSDVRKKKKL